MTPYLIINAPVYWLKAVAKEVGGTQAKARHLKNSKDEITPGQSNVLNKII